MNSLAGISKTFFETEHLWSRILPFVGGDEEFPLPRGNMATTEERIKQKAFQVGVSINKLPDYCGGAIGKTALADGLASGKLAQPIADTIEEALEVLQSLKIDAGAADVTGLN